MSVHITSLIVQKGQASKDFQIVCLLWSIASEDILVVELPCRNLMPCYGSRFVSVGLGYGVARGAHVDFRHLPFLSSAFDMILLLRCLSCVD